MTKRPDVVIVVSLDSTNLTAVALGNENVAYMGSDFISLAA
jgi:hypothetical protein